MAKTNWTFKPALLLMTGRTAGFAVTALMPLVLVRVFDQSQFGTYKQLFLVYTTLYALAQVGMAESLFYFVPSARRQVGRYVVNSMLVLAAAGLVCMGLLQVMGSNISSWLNNPRLAMYFPLMGVYLLLTLVSTTLEIAMISRKCYRWASLTYVFSDLLRSALFIIPVLFVPNLHSLLAGATAFAAFRVAMTCAYVKREFREDLRPDANLLKTQMAYAVPFEMAVIVDAFQSNFHQYAVSHYFDAATFAIYSVGCFQIPFVGLVASSVGNVLMVGMSEEIRDGRGKTVVALWHDTTRKLSLMFFPLVALLLVVAREFIVFLFTDQYVASVPIFMVWTTTIFLAVLQTDSVLRVYAETRFLFFLNAVRLVVILLLIHWFLSSFSLLGPVLVTILAALITKIQALARIRKVMRISVSQLLPWGNLAAILAVAAAAIVPVLLIKPELHGTNFLILAITGLVYFVSYSILLYSFGLLTDAEYHTLRGLWQRSKRWLQSPAAGAVEAGELSRN